MEPQSGIKTWQWVVTVIVIIALVIIGILVFGNKKSVPTGSENTPTGTQNMTGAYSIVMSDQYPGNVVYLSSVQAAEPVWVAIQKDNNGKPGAVIGSAHFEAGINPGKINLSSPTIDGMTYYAVMYEDDGSGSFNAASATPRKDANGNVVSRPFKASSSANLEIKG